MSALDDRIVLSIRLDEKSGKNQTVVCNLTFGPDGNPIALRDCVATFSDDHKACKPRTQIRNTKQVEITCGPVDAGFECVTGDVQIAVCRHDDLGWNDMSSAFAVRRRLLPGDHRP